MMRTRRFGKGRKRIPGSRSTEIIMHGVLTVRKYGYFWKRSKIPYNVSKVTMFCYGEKVGSLGK